MARSSSAAGGYTRLQMDDDHDPPHPAASVGGPEFSLPAPPAPIDHFGRPQQGADHGTGLLSPAHIPPPGSEPGSRHRGPRLGPAPPPQQQEQVSVTFDRDPPGPRGSSDKHNRCDIKNLLVVSRVIIVPCLDAATTNTGASATAAGWSASSSRGCSCSTPSSSSSASSSSRTSHPSTPYSTSSCFRR